MTLRKYLAAVWAVLFLAISATPAPAQLLLLGAGKGTPGPAAPTPTTFDSGNTAAVVSLDATKLIATKASGAVWASTRTIASVNGATCAYAEFTNSGTGQVAIGVASSGVSTTGFPGNDANGISNPSTDTNIYAGGGGAGVITSTWNSTGNKVKLVVKGTKVWFANIGQPWMAGGGGADPDTNTGGDTLPAGTVYIYASAEPTGSAITGNFGQSTFTDTPPAGCTGTF